MKTKKIIYCYRCGSKLEEHYNNTFNEETGERNKSSHCPNLKCTVGCGHDGHKFIWFSETCKRCGLTLCNY